MQLVVNTVGSRVINSWVDAIVKQVDYVFHYNSNIKNLKDHVEKLNGIRDIVKHRVDEARKNGEEIEDMVEKWFINVDEAIISATKILQDNDTAKKNCLMGFCPNVKMCHRLSRRAKKMTVAVDEIRKEGNFNRVSYRIALQGIGSFRDYEAFESRKLVLEEIMKALKDADVNPTGVYGMGGVGKSTFVKKVAVQLKEESIFKVVILVAVTQAPDLKRIQQQIADWIDFKFDVESIDARAAKLKKQLKREEKLLIILDDIWGSIDLNEVGIPFGDNHKGCKILMTSRNQNVLSEMGSQRNFQLEVLQENEAWYLFERKVGDFKDSNLQNIAIQIAKRCEGLPILIVTVAVALRGKPLYAWEDALKQLFRYENEGIDIRAKAYSALDVSYKHLDGGEIKSLFLLCSLLVSYRFPIRDLLIYCMGLGIFKDIHTLEDGRNRLYRLVYDLKAACLLLDGDKNGYIKMHEIVRNFAVSAASRDRGHNVLTVAYDGELEKWPDKNVLRKCTAMSFIRSNVHQLPEGLECPELRLFILYTKDRDLKIPDSFFKGMRGLNVLDLTNMCFPSWPSSLHYLENLRTLALYECEMGSIAIIAKLKTLEILCLINANLVRLPVEIGELTNLRMLDLRRCSNLQVIPPNVLSRLTKLEELCLENSFNQWELDDSNGGRINACLSELMNLTNLVSLDIHIPYLQIMPKYPFFDHLKRYEILIGDVWDWFSNCETSRMLKLKLDGNIRLEPWLQGILKRAEDLYLVELKGITNLMNELDCQGFLQLKHLHVQNSPEILYLVNFQERISSHAFPMLETLFLHNLMSLEKLWQGQFKAESFCRLRILKVEHCEKLKNLFSLTIMNGLLELQELEVNDCINMEQIVDMESEEIEYEIKFNHLRSLTLQYLPQITGFCSKSLENGSDDERKINAQLFTHKLKFPNLVDLKLFSINVEKIWPDHIVEEFQWIQNLTSLTIEGCGNLNYLFVSSAVKDLSQLKKLEIIDCSFIGEVVVAGGLEEKEEEEEIKDKILFPKLDFLKLKGLPKLTSFCTGNLIECPSLKVLWIENCPQLQTFISSYTRTDVGFNNGNGQVGSTLFDEKVSFPKLEELQISFLHRLKMIWPKELQAIPFCHLKVLKVEHDKELLKIFPSKMLRGFQNLESLVVQNCDLLEEVFDLEVSSEVQEACPAGANRLEFLELRNLPSLTHIWNQDPDGIASFPNIRSVFAWDCPRLTSLFPFSIAKNLPQLEILNIDGCGLKELVAKEERGEAAPKFIFAQLKSIALCRLEKLRCFYPEQHTLECPMLESLNVYLCDKLEVFTSEPQDLQGMNMVGEENQLKVQDLQSLFLFKKIVPNLEELALSNRDIIMIGRGQVPLDLFHKLKILHLQCFYDAPAGFPFAILQKFQNLEKLILRCCYVKEPFADVIVDEDAGALKQILHLKLDFFPNMKHIWHQDCQDGPVLENLRNLEIWNCPNLISLAPSSACFRNLKTLDVLKCQRLVNIMSSSNANTLVNLTNMSVRESNTVTEILADERDEIQSQVEIIFSKLESLKLHCLKSLSSFCSTARYAIQFPSLKEVDVIQCPKMKVFSEGVSAPKLKRVNVTEGRDRWHWIGDLNTTIKRLYLEMVGFSGIQHLKLSEFSDLKELWHDQLPANFFHSLSKLVVDECAFSSSAIPLNLLPFLNNLSELEVRFCESVEEVFSLDRSNGYVQYLSKLSKLRLIDLPKLKHVWNEYPSGILDFKNLTLLKIQGCSSLRNIFTPAMCLGLLQLQMIEVKDCPLIEEIITKDAARVGTIEMIITFPMLNCVTLQSLLGLKSFYSGSGIVHCPSLKEIITVDCPSKFASTFWREPETDAAGIIEQKLLFPNLRELKLSSVHIEKTWSPRQLEISSGIQNLTNLILDGFGNLKYVLSSTTTNSLLHLKRLEICDCKMMEGVIFMEGLEEEAMREILLKELAFLKLKDLPKLTRFCTSNLIECPALKELWVQNCPELMVFVSDYATTDMAACSKVEFNNSTLFNKKVLFPKLEKMHILNMDNLKMIWHNELHSDSFCQIKVLKVESSKELLRLFPANMFRSLQNLEDLVIRNCDSLEEVFDLYELINLRETIASQLRTLDIEKLPNLKHVWNEDPLGFLLFDKLNSVYAWNCPSLKVLFPFSIARCLLQLEILNIDGCGLEELVAKEAAEGTPKFVFPQLKSLDLWRLQELKCFYPGVHSLDCPMLERLRVYNCESMETFASESENLQEIYLESGLDFQIPQTLFSDWKMPNLEHLSLTVKDVKIILEGQFPVDLFHKLRVVEINCFHDESAIFPFGLLEIFQNMEKLVVWCSQFNELFPYEGCVSEEKYARTLRKIRHLQLDSLPDLKHIWNGDFQLDQIVQSLETLEILACDSLISLAPSSACFQNLIILDVVNCNGLVSLLTSSTAKSLVQLKKLRVEECNGVTDLVMNEGDKSKDVIIFSKLESLGIHSLPSLISFCSAEYSFKFPSLLKVTVRQCPHMKFFSKGVLSTPKLECVQLTEQENNDGRWNGNLNATIEHLFSEMVGVSGLQHLELSKLPELKEMWHGKLSVNFFFNLKSLLVDNCAFVSSAVPSNLLPFLNALEELEIRNCELLEEIFDFEWPDAVQHVGYLPNLKKFQLVDLPHLRHIWNVVLGGILDFNNLKLLKIHNCGHLRNIFTPTMCLSLVQLQEMEVKNCSMIEEVITECGAEEAQIERVIFPLLSFLALESLPRLISFYSGTGALECPSLTEITVVDCPFLPQSGPTTIHEATEQKAAFPNQKDLKTFSVDIERTQNGQLVAMLYCFQSLTSLIIDGCGYLKYLFSSSTVRSLVHLKMLEICDCKMMEEVITKDGPEEETMSKMLFHDLYFLKLKDLPKLSKFCTSILIECPALKDLRIQNCPELSTFVSNSVTADMAGSSKHEILSSTLFNEKVVLPSLEQMQILNMDNLKMIWHNKLHPDSFCKMKVLRMEHCKNLSKVFPSNLLRSFQDLEDLVIRNCDSLAEVFDLQEVLNLKEILSYNLRILDIRDLPNLKHVWNEDTLELLLFDNLSLMYVWNCPSLKVLFPTSVAGGLPQLGMLNIDSCGVEELVANQKGSEATPRFVFPRLKSLDLWRLEELRCFYPGIHILECPILERLHVYNCERLEIFASEPENLKETHLESQLEIQIPRPLFSFQIIVNLEHLSLTDKDAKVILEGQIPAEHFQKLKSIQLTCFHDESVVFPFDLLQIFYNMEKLVVGCSQFKQLFPDEGFVSKVKPERAMSQLQYLELDLLPDLKHIWNQNSQLYQVLQILECLIIQQCDSLINIAPSSASFQNLRTLDVMNCNGLVSLMTSSTAKSLVQLTKMSIKECDSITEIVAHNGEESKQEIIFSKMESLGLHCLPSLVSFCSAEHTLKFPSLIEISVRQCPRMQIFSKGVLSIPKLQTFPVTEQEDNEVPWNGNFNFTI